MKTIEEYRKMTVDEFLSLEETEKRYAEQLVTDKWIKNVHRKEIAEECRLEILKLIDYELESIDVHPLTGVNLHENIMKIIMGEK